jgi:hypothetical protein
LKKNDAIKFIHDRYSVRSNASYARLALVRRLLALGCRLLSRRPAASPSNRLTPEDFFIRSFAYDPTSERLEIRYRWKSVEQIEFVNTVTEKSTGVVNLIAG